VQLDGELNYEKWWVGLKAGRVSVSNGPLLRCRAIGQWPGHVFKAPAGQGIELKLEVVLDSRDPIDTIEIIQNGQVIRTISASELKRTGSPGGVHFNESGWFLVRAMAAVPETFASLRPDRSTRRSAHRRGGQQSLRAILPRLGARAREPDQFERPAPAG
jgi:hypothetical protein